MNAYIDIRNARNNLKLALCTHDCKFINAMLDRLESVKNKHRNMATKFHNLQRMIFAL